MIYRELLKFVSVDKGILTENGIGNKYKTRDSYQTSFHCNIDLHLLLILSIVSSLVFHSLSFTQFIFLNHADVRVTTIILPLSHSDQPHFLTHV